MNQSVNHSDKSQPGQRISYLIEVYNRQSITPEEHDELDAWVGASDENMRVFEELTGKYEQSKGENTTNYIWDRIFHILGYKMAN